MHRRFFGVLAVVTASVLALTACSGSNTDALTGADGAPTPQVGVILPDSASSPRWEAQDRPYLKDAFDAAGITSDIQNAGNDVAAFQTIADTMIRERVKVILIVALNANSGSAVITKANAAGIPVIDYDRLSLGGGAQYYVSYDNVAVGTAIGEGLIKCMRADGHRTGPVVELDGSPSDNNATLFRQGYNSVLTRAGYTIAADVPVPDWDSNKGGSLFSAIDSRLKGDFVGVAAANDNLGGAVVADLKSGGRDGQIPVTGQDASIPGLQRLLLGTQCVSIYKSSKLEADTAAKLAIDLVKGDTAAANAIAKAQVIDPTNHKPIKSVLLKQVSVTASTVETVVADRAATAAEICTTAALQAACDKYHVK